MNENELADRLASLLENHLPGGDPGGPIQQLQPASAFGPFAQEDYKIHYFRLFVEMLNCGRLVPWDALSYVLHERHGNLFDEKIIREDVLPSLHEHWDAWAFMWKNRAELPLDN